MFVFTFTSAAIIPVFDFAIIKLFRFDLLTYLYEYGMTKQLRKKY